MIIDIRGVLENGEPRESTVPASTGCHVAITSGEDATLRLYATTPAGIPLDATTWSRLSLTIRKAVSDTFAKAIVIGAVDSAQGKGRWTFALSSDLTRKLVAGNYLFDIWAESAGQRLPVVVISTLFVVPAVGRAGETV